MPGQDLFSVFTQSLGHVLFGALQIIGVFSASMSRFGALEFVLSLTFIFIFIKRLFGRFSSGSSDTARKPKSKGSASK